MTSDDKIKKQGGLVNGHNNNYFNGEIQDNIQNYKQQATMSSDCFFGFFLKTFVLMSKLCFSYRLQNKVGLIYFKSYILTDGTQFSVLIKEIYVGIHNFIVIEEDRKF